MYSLINRDLAWSGYLLQQAGLFMKGEMFEVRVTDDHNAGLEHIADLNSLLSLSFLSELN